MMDHYILNNKEPMLEPDLIKWAAWLEDATNKRVDFTQIHGCNISTVFLGMDHSFGDSGRPVLFETMIFGGALDGEQCRYCTWDEAEKGHEEMVELVKKSMI